MTASPDRFTMSVEEYLELDRNGPDVRYEYVDGYAYMLASGTLNHATISANVYSTLRSLLRGSSCRAYTSDAKVIASKNRYFYPDVTVTCDKHDQGEIDAIASPRVIFEVLSPTTEDYDRGDKFLYYRECPTIQEYVLISARRPMVEIFRRESSKLWMLSVYKRDDDVKLSSLNVHFPIDALYEDVLLPEDAIQPD